MRRFLIRMSAVAGLAVLPVTGLVLSAPAHAATTHSAAAAAPGAVAPPGDGGGWTYAGWFISATSCNLHGTIGEWFGEWSTYQCVQVSDNPDDGYYMWIA